MVTRSKKRPPRMVVRGYIYPTRTGRCAGVPRNPACTPSAPNPGQRGCDRLKVALAVSAEVALIRQNSKQDADIAECLRHGAVSPLSIQIKRISRLQFPSIKNAT